MASKSSFVLAMFLLVISHSTFFQQVAAEDSTAPIILTRRELQWSRAAYRLYLIYKGYKKGEKDYKVVNWTLTQVEDNIDGQCPENDYGPQYCCSFDIYQFCKKCCSGQRTSWVSQNLDSLASPSLSLPPESQDIDWLAFLSLPESVSLSIAVQFLLFIIITAKVIEHTF